MALTKGQTGAGIFYLKMPWLFMQDPDGVERIPRFRLRGMTPSLKLAVWAAAFGFALAGPLKSEDVSPMATPPEDHGAVMKRVGEVLDPILAKLPAAAVTRKEEERNAHEFLFLPQTFKIHGIGMTGEISREARDEVGPSYKGFVLRIYRQKLGVVNQIATPCSLREPYWTTEVDLTPVKGSDSQLFWSLSYGVRTDPKLLAEIKAALGGLKEQEVKP